MTAFTMDSRERIQKIIAGEQADRCGLWLGEPAEETWEIYCKYFGTDREGIRQQLHDDFRWCGVWQYKGPNGEPMFPIPGKDRHGFAGPFADIEEPEQIDSIDYPWPDPDYLDFEPALAGLKAAGGHYRASGLWTPFYHSVMDLVGMENYLMKMFEAPEALESLTNRVCEFYYEGNRRFLEVAGDEMDGFFFGNDFGTQLDLICGPKQFDQFILPWFKKFIELARSYGKQIILHSCGSIYRVVDRLIDANVQCLHPLQAKAANMSAEKLSESFGGRISFMGGIDTQQLLVRGTPEEVKQDVRRVKELLGPRLIVSPSHEAVLPNVPPQNIVALAEAALE